MLGAAVGIAYLAAGWEATAATIAILALAALLLASGMDAGRPSTVILTIESSASKQYGEPPTPCSRTYRCMHNRRASSIAAGMLREATASPMRNS